MTTLIGVKSHFSIGESILDPKDLVKLALDQGYEALAIADTMNINSLVTVFSEGKKKGVKVVIGAAVRVVDDLGWRKAVKGEPKKKPNPFFMPKLFVKNEDGLRDLMALLTLAGDADHFYMQAQVSVEELRETLSKGNLICTSGDAHSVFSHASYTSILLKIADESLRSSFVTEAVPIKTSYYDRVTLNAIQWETSTRPNEEQIVISRPVFHAEGAAKIRNTLNCIESRQKITDIWRASPVDDLHALSRAELNARFVEQLVRISGGRTWKGEVKRLFLRAVAATADFKDLFDYEWEKMPISLPDMAEKPFEELCRQCVVGWKKRILFPALGYQVSDQLMPTYRERLKYELSVLRAMGFENYFLLVSDLVAWCKESDIMVGPGRGSVGGSLVAFLMGITDVDPIRFGLIFERFINPDRLDLPDIDLDFMSSRREEVIEYLTAKYGSDHVAGIANYGVLGGASSLRSVSSAHNLTESEFSCSKQVPKEHGQPVDLMVAKSIVADIEKFANAHPEIWQEAVDLQGVFRNYGKHAAGVIVAKDKIAHRAVINTRDVYPSVNWDKRVVEDFGLVKLDVLGLQTLDLLHHAKVYLRQSTGENIEYTDLPLDDREILDAFGRGDTIGVFQFEGGGMRHLLKELAAAEAMTFNEITAATALFRPGPLESGLTESYIQIRQGADLPSYIHPNMEPALRETYSVIVYQESVMQVARDLAGFTMAEADKLRKAMGKKSPEEMAKMRDAFVDGCLKTSGLTGDVATELFDQIESFAGYAFNKSHSVEYTILSYWSMYMKVRHPGAFYAAALTILDETKRLTLVKAAQAAGIAVLPPDINISTDRFEIRKVGGEVSLYAPFQMLKGLSEKGSAAILAARVALGRPFANKAEFLLMVNKRVCNIRVQESLDKVGAFANIEEQLPATDSSRLKDQKTLLPQLMTGNVVSERGVAITDAKAMKIFAIMEEVSKAGGDLQFAINEARAKAAGPDGEFSPKTCIHPMPFIGTNPSVFVIMDCPNWTEVKSSRMGSGDACSYLRIALKACGLTIEDCYITALVKCGKEKEETITNAMINCYSDFLKQELEVINPPVIVALGSKAVRFLLPDTKGGWEEICGQTHYDAGKDATIFCGMNPSMIHFEPGRQNMLNDVFAQAKTSLPIE